MSADAVTFLHDLLKFDPEKRLNIDQLVSHPYLNIPVADLTPIQASPEFNKIEKESLVFVKKNQLVFNIRSSKQYNLFAEKFKKKIQKNEEISPVNNMEMSFKLSNGGAEENRLLD